MFIINTKTEKREIAHCLGITDGDAIFQFVEGWEPVDHFCRSDEDGNWISLLAGPDDVAFYLDGDVREKAHDGDLRSADDWLLNALSIDRDAVLEACECVSVELREYAQDLDKWTKMRCIDAPGTFKIRPGTIFLLASGLSVQESIDHDDGSKTITVERNWNCRCTMDPGVER